MAFALSMYPIVYVARFNPDTKKWNEKWIYKDKVPYKKLQKMSEKKRDKIYTNRNNIGLPTVSYTSQYGYGCFEGMKAFPTKNGKIGIFRPDQNAARFANSMRGLKCEPFPEDRYIKASEEFIKRNAKLGYLPSYNAEWENDNYATAAAVYMRPFMNSEGAIGVGCAQAPYVVICATTVSSYFKGGNTKAITTKRIRATSHGTGFIKCASNYVISALAKKEAEDAGYMECVFLDADEQKNIQEGSSCNIFFVMKDGIVCTPELADTILPGITRASILTLAQQAGYTTQERKISIDEALSNAVECFVTGTAAGITPIESISHNGVETVFNDRKPGNVATRLQATLKSIQYGKIDDTNNWVHKVL